jgi:hypothetical protein
MWDIYIYFVLLTVNACLWGAKLGHLSPGIKVLGVAILTTLAMESFAFYLMEQNTNNLFLYHMLIPIQYILYTVVFLFSLSRPREKKVLLASIPLYLLVIILIMLLLQSTVEFNSYARVLNNILISGWALLYYREVFTGFRIVNLTKEPMFWVSTGLMFFSLGSFFVDGLMNHIIETSSELGETLYYIKVFLGFLLNTTFLFAFLLSKRVSAGQEVSCTVPKA